MTSAGKLIRISENLSIYILENEDGSYLTTEGVIRYRNIGSNFEQKFEQEHNCNLDVDGMLSILDEIGNAMMHFPAIWLDTDQMKLVRLAEKGLIKFTE